MMHRNQLRSLLKKYQPTSEEVVYKDRMLAFLDEHEDAFERSLTIGHFTASAWITSFDDSQALLMHHAKLNIWVQLGGHADGDTDLLAVAVKEAQEESGIMGIEPVSVEIFDIDIHTIPANSKNIAHEHFDVRFIVRVISDEKVIQNHESKELRWIDGDIYALPTQERSVVRLFEKWQNLK
jgi:8-oxo-dGTP pyrophosphatase MutT (NUDIX family)